PDGRYMTRLNVPGGKEVEGFAIASNYEPKKGTPWYSVTRVGDAGLDALFGQAPNDLVVPRDGVFTGVTAAGFPIPDDRCLLFGDSTNGNDGVIHTEFFSEPRTQQQILSWLTSTGQTRALVQTRGSTPITIEQLEQLRPHVINLSNGTFRKSGKYSTSPADVDDIFRTHIPEWFASGGGQGKRARVVFFAHGGLVDEQSGLGVALKHVEWWKANGVYPVYFVWETGLFDALRSILESIARQIPGLGARGFADDITDHLVEKGVRALGGAKVWQAMKTNAGLASEPTGGARYTAERLKELCDSGMELELHAVGHSAGSIFHSYFLPLTQDLGVPAFTSMQFLAPAIRMDAFIKRLMPIVGPAEHVRSARMFSMTDRYEKDDNCITIYRKSLLYLIYHSLESKSETPILGLETSVADNPDVRRFFTPQSGGPASAVWSVTASSAPANAASRSTSHGGFDDDAATMSSVVAHVVNQAAAPVPYPGSRSFGSDWPMSQEWKGDMGLPVDSGHLPEEAVPVREEVSIIPSPQTVRARPSQLRSGRRAALCVGINDYNGQPLAGCVADAQAWANAFRRLDFDVTLVTDKNATFEGITSNLKKIVGGARAGDIIAFQYAGHGYQIRDLDGDEDDQQDEAFVPFDFESGAFILDDDIRDILSHVKAGVSVSCFMDCCCSGTIARLWNPTRRVVIDKRVRGERSRYLKTTTSRRLKLEEAHERFRSAQQKERSSPLSPHVGPEVLRWVTFSACQPREAALEHEGRGDFSVNALDVLSRLKGGTTNIDFHNMVMKRFGADREQTPFFDRRSQDDAAEFLGGIVGT
ncbi:MAG TPA: caspase family protein, partial [Gemmatimonadaceae bacterium]|nr:caspase family protein [Gemmatimonadaceae bacterium]